MSGVEEVRNEGPYYMILQFDPRNSESTLFGDVYADSEYNVNEAKNDAASYAEQASAKGLPFRYSVVRVEYVATYAPIR